MVEFWEFCVSQSAARLDDTESCRYMGWYSNELHLEMHLEKALLKEWRVETVDALP